MGQNKGAVPVPSLMGRLGLGGQVCPGDRGNLRDGRFQEPTNTGVNGNTRPGCPAMSVCGSVPQ